MSRQLEIPWGRTGTVRVGAGPRATERLLLSDLETTLDELGTDILQQPVCLVVPSHSLRVHILGRLLAARGRAVAGLSCRTHHSWAAQIVGAPEASAEAAAPFALLARRFSRNEPELARALEHLRDGYVSVVSTIADLLDAGLLPAHRDALLEALTGDEPSAASRLEIARAQALVRGAAATAAAMEKLGLERSSTLLAAATVRVRSGAVRRPAAVFIYGYSDATGVATDFLQSLVDVFDARVYLDLPPDPARPERSDEGIAFSRRFSERLVGSAEPKVEAMVEEPRIEMFKAAGTDSEVRHVGLQARALIAAGQKPESIAVVARDLAPYLLAIRTQFDRLGLPFSGIGASAPPTPVASRVAALLDLLLLRGSAPTERWLEARAPSSLRAPDFDVRLAFHVIGAARLEEAASVILSEKRAARPISLPVCHELVTSSRDDATGAAHRRRAAKRRIPAKVVQREARRAARLSQHLQTMTADAPLATHLENLGLLITRDLGWTESDELCSLLLAEAHRVVGPLDPSFVLDGDEFLDLLRSAWSRIGATAIGGDGGGIQVLDVIEARARTFEHLFLVGMNRGTFPRTVREDPVLPDALRRVLGRRGHGVLPDLPSKLDGYLEERFLFAQLLAASPAVTISWQEVDDDHAFRTPSPLVERLRIAERSGRRREEPPSAAATLSAGAVTSGPSEPKSAWEAATLAGLFAGRDRRRYRDLLALALEESASWEGDSRRCAAVAAARVRTLDEIDPPRGLPAGERVHRRLGPFLGLVGQPRAAADPRHAGEINITALEGMARCPWQHFLRRVLAVEALPDPLDLLPSLEQRLIGNLVHGVLEDIVRADLGEIEIEDLENARRAPGSSVEWPHEEELRALLGSRAERLVQKEGIALAGFGSVLARHAELFLDAALTSDWPHRESRLEIVGAEQRGFLDWGNGITIRFRADRVDRRGAGLVLTDYKTGSSVFGRSRARLSRAALANGIASGAALQACAYALAAGTEGDAGRYLFLHPCFDEQATREIAVSADDDDLVAGFRAAVDATLAAWKLGTFLPRLERPDKILEPIACSYCDLSDACVRGDSGARGRLRDWIDRYEGGSRDGPETEAVREAFATLWLLAGGGKGKT